MRFKPNSTYQTITLVVFFSILSYNIIKIILQKQYMLFYQQKQYI